MSPSSRPSRIRTGAPPANGARWLSHAAWRWRHRRSPTFPRWSRRRAPPPDVGESWFAMKIDGKPFRTIWLGDDGRTVEVIDQTRLAHDFVLERLRTCVAARDSHAP